MVNLLSLRYNRTQRRALPQISLFLGVCGLMYVRQLARSSDACQNISMSRFKKHICGVLATLSMLPVSGCTQGQQPLSPAKRAITPTEFRFKNVYPTYQISDVLKKHKEAKTFRISWVSKVGPFFESTDILYNREKKTLKYHYRENNIGILRNDLFSNVTDEALHRLAQTAEATERKKHIAVLPRTFFDDLPKFGCQKVRLKATNKLPNKALHPTAYSFAPFARSSLRLLRFRRRVSLVVLSLRARCWAPQALIT
jgi:hypothetical protein